MRFGGHFVQVWIGIMSYRLSADRRWQAHVDTTAAIVSRSPDGESVRLTFELSAPSPETPNVMRYIVPKGYIAIDGSSLTVTEVNDAKRTFGVMLIKHTQERITLGTKSVGEKVNIEVDMVGKYVEKSVVAALGGGDSGNNGVKAMVRNIVEEVLREREAS